MGNSDSRRSQSRGPISHVSPTGVADNPPPGTPSKNVLTAIAIALTVLFAWAYWPTLADIVAHWNSNPDYSHGYLVVPLVAWFLWMRRGRAPIDSIAPAWGGFSLILLAATARIVSARLYLPEVDAWSIPLWIGGACWLCFGWRTFLWAAPSIAFLWFMVPLPGTVETMLSGPLQGIATRMSTWTLQCLGQPALAEGTTILLNEPPPLEVERACSGLRLFYGILALSVAYVMLVRVPIRRAVVLILSVAPVALLANTARIVGTGLVQQMISGEAARKFSHDFAGILMVVLAVPMFALVSLLLAGFEKRLQRSRSGAMLAVAACLLLIAVLVPAAYGWHAFQQQRNVQALLDRASTLEQEEKWAEAVGYLDRFLRTRSAEEELRPQDVEVMARLARAFDKASAGTSRRGHALDLYAEAWAADPDNIDLGIRHAELALELQRYAESSTSAQKVLAQIKGDQSLSKNHALAARISALAILGPLVTQQRIGEPGEWKSAVSAMQQAISLNPSDVELAVRLGEVYRKYMSEPEEQERIKLADAVLDQLVEKNPEYPPAYLARYRFHMRYRPENGSAEYDANTDADLDRALEIGRKDKSKEHLDVILTAGERAYQRNQLKDAESLYRRATELAPLDHRGWLRLGEVQFTVGTDKARDQAIETWRSGLKSVGGAQQPLSVVLPLVVQLSGALIDLGRIPEAEERLKSLEDVIPQLREPGKSGVRFGVTMLKARAKAVSGKHGEAVVMLRRLLNTEVGYEVSLQLKAQYANIWRTLGDYYTVLQDPDQAAHAFEQAGRLDPATPEWHWKAAQACESSGRFADAVTLLETAARQNSTNAKIWLSLARVSLIHQVELPASKRDWQTFRRAVDRAVQLKADGLILTILQADYAMAEDRPQEAVAKLEHALKQVPDSADLWRSMAIVRHRTKSEPELEKALAEYSRCSKDAKGVAVFRAGLLAVDGKIDEARAVLSEAIPKLSKEEQIDVRFEIAQLDLQSSRYDEGRKELQELTRLRPGDVGMLEMQARLALESLDWKSLEEIEKNLNRVEGEDGSNWRYFRARRLLATAVDVEEARFREAIRLTDELDRVRPSWHRTAALRGQIARREGRGSDAVQAYELAVRLGNKSIALAEELIDLLTEQRRFSEADKQLERVRDAVARSSRLSSVAIPIYVRRGEADEALRLAEDWIKREPNDPASYLRLGRTLLITSGEGKTDANKETLNRAEQAFSHAVQLGPTDVRTWVALFHFHLRYRQNERAALDMLSRLAERIDILPARKAFVLAQLYESVGRKSQADRNYREAVKLAPDAAQAQVCERAAQFFVTEDPSYAESLSRKALELTPGSLDARRTLVLSLAEQGGDQRLAEATEIFAKLEEGGRQIPADRRLHSVLLVRRGRPEDKRRAISILESLVQIPQQAQPRDRLQLAALYEEEKRIQPAYEQMWTVARQPNALPPHLVSFVEFLFRNVKEQPQFAARAETTLGRLEADPATMVSALRLRLEWAKKSNPDEARQKGAVQSTIDRFVKLRLKEVKDEAARKDVFTGLLMLLIRESLLDQAVRMCRESSPLDKASSAACLAAALTVSHDADELIKLADPLFAEVSKAKSDDVDLVFSLANLHYVHGRRNEAVESYRKVLALQPKHKLAANNLALALSDDPSGLDEALKIVKQALEALGPDAGLLDTHAIVLLRQKKAGDARKILEESTESNESDPLHLLHLAAAYRGEGETEKARRAFQKALDLDASRAVITPGDRDMLKELQGVLVKPVLAN